MGFPRAWHQHRARGWLPCTRRRPVRRCKLVVCSLYGIQGSTTFLSSRSTQTRHKLKASRNLEYVRRSRASGRCGSVDCGFVHVTRQACLIAVFFEHFFTQRPLFLPPLTLPFFAPSHS